MDPGINYEDITLEELSEKIFDYPIKGWCSVPISFDGINLKEMHEALLMFFTNGMNKLFGNSNGNVNLLEIKEEEFLKINQYFHSLGININYKLYDIFEYDNMILTHFNKTEKNNLEDYCFKLKVENKIFVLWFNILKV
jgi:hypothetical protein